MAQTIGRIVLFVTGGYAGTALYNNQEDLPSFLGETFKSLKELLKGNGGNSNNNSSNSNVEKQVEQLSQDMRSLMLSGRGGTIVVSSQGTSLTTKVVMILVPGVGVYLWYKGFRFSDLTWVSRNNFQQAMSSVQGAQTKLERFVFDFREAVQKRIADFQNQVGLRFGAVEKQIDEKVGEVRDGVAQAQSTLEGLDERVQRLEGKVDESNNSLQYTSRGIKLLCRYDLTHLYSHMSSLHFRSPIENAKVSGFFGSKFAFRSVVAESVSGSSKSARELQFFAQTNPSSSLLEDSTSPLAMLGAPGGAPVLVDVERSNSPTTPTVCTPTAVSDGLGVGARVGLMLGGTIPQVRVGSAFGPRSGSQDMDTTSNPPCPQDCK
mmetsp:Transcript_26818/g.70463  ORF Transcript_26818/g.70463 Transcript_26818/m.70463 type:complete len:377 (-) Transcript_26818:454-1584(-)